MQYRIRARWPCSGQVPPAAQFCLFYCHNVGCCTSNTFQVVSVHSGPLVRILLAPHNYWAGPSSPSITTAGVLIIYAKQKILVEARDISTTRRIQFKLFVSAYGSRQCAYAETNSLNRILLVVEISCAPTKQFHFAQIISRFYRVCSLAEGSVMQLVE